MLACVFGAVILGGGTLLVSANDGPNIYGTIRDFAPARRAAPPVVQRIEAPLPRVFRQRETPPPRALGYSAQPSSFAPLNRVQPIDPAGRSGAAQREFPRGAIEDNGALQASPARETRSGVRKQARRKLHQQESLATVGIASSTNYCVRLCDGFAFPVGDAGGNFGVQEAACRQACPGAPTLLYSAPAGAKDFDALSRGGASYSALPNAFRYREKVDNTCRCNTPGATASASAILADLTLRRGDLVMSNAGMRHFDGASRMPYRRTHFSDAVAKLSDKREVAVVRAMEVASVRGILSSKAPDYIRDRVVLHVRAAEREAQREVNTGRKAQLNLGRGFQELRAREMRGPTVLKTVQRGPGMVALN